MDPVIALQLAQARGLELQAEARRYHLAKSRRAVVATRLPQPAATSPSARLGLGSAARIGDSDGTSRSPRLPHLEPGLIPPAERPTSAQPSSALISALTTEHYTLQSARGSTITEANGRSSLFLSAVSGATVALALVAQLDRMGETFLVFAFTILPALLMLGLMSYARLADLAVHDAYYARAIGRIRRLYFDVAGNDARRYWLVSAGDDKQALMRHAGQRLTRSHLWTHQATAVAAVTAVIAGVLGGLALKPATALTLPVMAIIGVLIAALVLVASLVDQERRWRRSDQGPPALVTPDGAPTGADGQAAEPGSPSGHH
jgi:hypothetical protein